MELFAAPPMEFAAIADPSARGAAPLLPSASAGSRGPPPAVPFDLLLGVLTEALPDGEAWPVGGKELPPCGLDAGSETAPLTGALTLAAPILPQLAEAVGGSHASLESSLASRAPTLPTPDPSAAVTSAALVPLDGVTEPAPAASGARPPILADLAPAEIVPDAFDAPLLPPADDATAPSHPEPQRLERLFTIDARVRAQIAAATAPEPRAGTPTAPGANLTHLPPVPELRRLPAQEGTPALRSGVRHLDSLGPLTAPSASGEAPSGDWFATHVHAHNTTGTVGASPSAPTLPQAPVDARQPDWHEALAQRVQWLVDTDAGEARIKLNPPELGAVDVKISLVDDKTHVHLTAATAAARDELAHALPRLRELFTVSGLELGSATVHDGRGGGHPYPGGEHARRGDDAFHESANAPLVGVLDEPAAGPRAIARGRIDVFA